ncbi:MAG: AAA family ATPase [Candidatus Omnitrophica bacterium]|nr:AAA family ATPase [Candidatus Omnitrophota bacterium]
MRLYLRKIISTITLVALLSTSILVDLFADQNSSNLAPWLTLSGGNAQRLVYFALHVPRITYAESEGAKELLERHFADALLLPNGSCLVDKSIFDNDASVIKLFETRDIPEILKEAEASPAVTRVLFRLTRVVLHENVEKLMRVIAATDHVRYTDMAALVFSQKKIIGAYSEYLPGSSRKRPATGDLLLNDIVASAFELILLKRGGIIDEGGMSAAESAFAREAELVFAANRHNYFNAPFWDERELNTAVTKSLHIGYAGPMSAHPKKPDTKTGEPARENPKTLKEKISILNKDLKFTASGTFEKRFALYYILRLALISDADQNKADDFKLHYRQMLALLETIGTDLKTVKDNKIAKLAKEVAESGRIPDFVLGQAYTMTTAAEVASAIRKELTGLATLEFDKKTRAGIDTAITDIVDELYDDEAARQSMKEDLTSDIKTYHFANLIPIDSLEDDFSIHRESYRDKLISLPAALGAYACKIAGEDLVLTHIFSDGAMIRPALVHEIFHYLADRGEIKMPPEAESITFTAQFLDAITKAPGGNKEKALDDIGRPTGLPLFRELLNRGLELGHKGEVGFKVLPGLTGERAEYFSLKGLLLEAQIIFKDNGLDPAPLDHPYAAQMAISAILTGQLLGLHEKEGVKPLRLLKDFFNDLARRCAPPSPEFLAWINADGGLLSELKRYASYLFAKRMSLVRKAEGLWSYEDKGELSGIIHYVETDLYPRPTDGIDENDIDGKKKAVRERALAQLILAVSRSLYGRHELAERSMPEWNARAERRLLWDGALTANTVYSALGRNQARSKEPQDREKYRGAGLWITRLFKDRYLIGNPVIERALLTSLPPHLQYLDSILYRWAFYESAKGSLADPRLVSEKVKEALTLTQGSARAPGWEALMFHPGQLKDDEIVAIIRDKMLPAYERLYDDAVKEAERKAAYEKMLKEEKAEDMRKAIDQLTEQELDNIDKYLGGLSDPEREEIKERAKEEMEKALQEYMEKSQGREMPFMDETPKDGASGESAKQGMGQSKPGEGRPGQGKPGAGTARGGSEGVSGSISSIKDRMNALEKNIDKLSGHLEEAESKTGDAGELSKGIQDAPAKDRKDDAGKIDGLAEEIQADVNASLQNGRDIEAAADKIHDGAVGAADKLPQGKAADDARKDSEGLAGDSAGLKERLERLQEAANRLKSIAGRLNDTVSGAEVDESHVRGQSDAISETIGRMKDLIKDIKENGGDIERTLSKLEEDLKQLEAAARDMDKRKRSAKEDKDGAAQSEGARQDGGNKDAGAVTTATKPSDIAPTEKTLEGLADIARKCGSDLSEKNTADKPIGRSSIFDKRFLDGLDQEEAQRDRLREPLTDKEQKLYDRWMEATKPVIAGMTNDLRARLNIPNVGIEIESGQWTGPKLKDLVKGVMGLPPFAKRHEKEPRRVKITLLVDRSGSMTGDRIKYAALTVFTLLNTVFNLNEELERLGFDPVEFETGLFTTADKMNEDLQISHETVAAKPHICRERLIFNIMSKITAGGGTNDVSALGRYVTRMIESPDRGTDRSYRIFVSIGDANLGTDSNISDIQAIIRHAKESGVHIFGVSVGNDDARRHMKKVYGPDNSILPNSLSDLPGDIMRKINECIPMPRRTAGISQYLASYLPWAFPLALGFDRIIEAASKFLLSTNFNNAAKTRALEKIDGYRHFYIEKSADKEYLVFIKDGVPERRWQRGAGGAYVPQVKVPDIDTNEELILSILNAQEDFGRDHLIELIGETGLGKGEILRSAAHLLNEEHYFIAGNEDMEVEDLSETRSLGNAAAGVSGYEPSIIAQVQHNGGWVVLDERNKIPAKVLNQLKSHLSGGNHVWNEKDDKGNSVKRTIPNHPRARIFSTINPHRAGIQSVAGILDQAMQRRVKRIEFTWLPPEEETRMQSSYAREFAVSNGVEYSPQLKTDIENMIDRLVRIATKERLRFAGYNASQIGKIIKDWRLLKDKSFNPAGKRGEYLKRPPSPRVIKSVIRHMILYPEDLKYRPWSVILRYYNYEAENDKLNTFSNVINDFAAEGIVDDPSVPPLKLDASSFAVDDGHLIIRPLSAPGVEGVWDTIRVPLSLSAAIRSGELPERVKFWIRTPQNALMLYHALQSIELGRDIIFVGEQETGKSKLAEAIAELLSGTELEIQPITFSTSKEDITFTPQIGEDGAKAFQSGYKAQRLPRAMDDGKGRGKILIMEETTQGRPGIIGLLNEVAERGELPYPFSKKVIRKQPGFAIIHTINPPTKDYDVSAFSDEFLERHTIMGFTPLAPGQSYGYISDASKMGGLQAHPRLIGEIERDNSGNEVLINGRPKYKGILGIEQYIRDLRAKDPALFPRAPGVGTNMNFAVAIRNNYEFYRSYYGLNSQGTLMKIFTELFTLDGPEEKAREWHKQIKAAFVYAGLWTDEAGKDAVNEYLRGEDVLVEGLPVLRKPDTGSDDLDRMLKYIQENTRGVRFKEMLGAVNKRCGELYDDMAWAKLGFGEKIEKVHTLKEIYQVVRAILRERPADMYDAEDRKKFELISENIVSNLLIKKNWPDEALTAEYAKDEFVKRCVDVVSCGDMEIDDMIGKIALFSDNEDYAGEIYQKLQSSLRARMNTSVSRTLSEDSLKNSAILDKARAALAVIASEAKQSKKDIQSLIEEIAAYLQKIAADRAAGKGASGKDIAARLAEVNMRINDARSKLEDAIAKASELQAPSLNDLDLEKTRLALTIGEGKDIDTPLSSPRGVSFSSDGKSIAVANNSNNTVSIIDLKTRSLVLTIGEGKDIDTLLYNPNGVSLSADGKSIAVANTGNNTVSIIDLKTTTLALTIGEGKDIDTPLSSPRDVSFSSDGKRARFTRAPR